MQKIDLRLASEQREYQSVFSQNKSEKKISTAKKILQRLSTENLGSAFLYVENDLWLDVKNDIQYSVSSSVESVYDDFLDSNEVLDYDEFLFVGPGSSSEVDKLTSVLKDKKVKLDFVDISTLSLIHIFSNCNVASSGAYYGADFISEEFISAWNDSANSSFKKLAIIKGGTSGNIKFSSFVNFLNKTSFNGVFIDFFKFDPNIDYSSIYEIDSVVILALYNYMLLLSILGLSSKDTGINKGNSRVSSKFVSMHSPSITTSYHDEFDGVTIICSYIFPEGLKKKISDEFDVEVPEEIELFRSKRVYASKYIEGIKDAVPGIKLIDEYNNSTVGGLFFTK